MLKAQLQPGDRLRGSWWQRASHVSSSGPGIGSGCSDAAWASATGLNWHSELPCALLGVGGRVEQSWGPYSALPCSFFAHPHLTLALPYIPTYKAARVYPIHEDFPKNNPSLPITLNTHSTEGCHCRRLETQKPSVLLSNVHSQWNSIQVCQENNGFASLLFF